MAEEYVTLTESALNHLQIHSIGLVAAEWGYAESMLETLIWRLSQVDTQRGRSITTHLLSVTRQDIAKTLANETLFDLGELAVRDEIIAAVEEFDDLRQRRNRIIHAHWQLPDQIDPMSVPALSGAVSRTIKAKGKLEQKEQIFDPLEIHNTAHEITLLIIRLGRAIQMLSEPRPTIGIGLAELSPEQIQNLGPRKK